jgi:serine/threonine protein kinase
VQVASGLAYLHAQKIVYYDLKSPNILVFKFPSVQESLQATQGQGYMATPTTAKHSGKSKVHMEGGVTKSLTGFSMKCLQCMATMDHFGVSFAMATMATKMHQNGCKVIISSMLEQYVVCHANPLLLWSCVMYS